MALGIGIAAVLLYFCTGLSILELNYPCMFNKLTGLCCPGCGGTRAARALMKGEILKSIYDYPPLLFGVVIYIVFMVRCFLYIHFGVPKSKDGAVIKYLYIFLAIMIVQWIAKIIAQVCFDYYWFCEGVYLCLSPTDGKIMKS